MPSRSNGSLPLVEGEWLDVVETRTRYLFLSEWPTKDWARILLAISFTVPMIAIYAGWRRRLIVAALVVGGSGLFVSFIGTDILHNVLLSQVQTSRADLVCVSFGQCRLWCRRCTNLYRKSEEDGDAFFFLYVLAWTIGHILWPVPGLDPRRRRLGSRLSANQRNHRGHPLTVAAPNLHGIDISIPLPDFLPPEILAQILQFGRRVSGYRPPFWA